MIDQHDYNTKLDHVRQFLDEGNKVRLVVRSKGRTNPELSQALLNRLIADLEPVAQFEKSAKSEIPSMVQFMLLASPLPKKVNKPKV